jgi:hypothetical protein
VRGQAEFSHLSVVGINLSCCDLQLLNLVPQSLVQCYKVNKERLESYSTEDGKGSHKLTLPFRIGGRPKIAVESLTIKKKQDKIQENIKLNVFCVRVSRHVVEYTTLLSNLQAWKYMTANKHCMK